MKLEPGPGLVWQDGRSEVKRWFHMAYPLDASAAGREDYAYLIYALLTLELWLQTFVDQPGVEITL